ncbi:MAG: hypothetical protein ACREMK_06280 [Gemmatimonadota bacterium]
MVPHCEDSDDFVCGTITSSPPVPGPGSPQRTPVVVRTKTLDGRPLEQEAEL